MAGHRDQVPETSLARLRVMPREEDPGRFRSSIWSQLASVQMAIASIGRADNRSAMVNNHPVRRALGKDFTANINMARINESEAVYCV